MKRSTRFTVLFALVALLAVSRFALNQDTQDAQTPEVSAVVETEPVLSSGDAADDVAIWLHPDDPAESVIVATDKDRGLVIYDLKGTALQHLQAGEINNVDLRYDFPLGGERVTLIAGSNRTNESVIVLTLDPATRQLRPLPSVPINVDLEDAYGLCMYRSPKNNRFYVFVTSTGDGKVEQWELFDHSGLVGAQRVRSFTVGSDVEGCVADDQRAILYISEETRGIWRYGAEPSDADERILIDEISEDGHLKADLEGLALYRVKDGAGYLVASNQGHSEFAVYDRADNYAYLGSFKITGQAPVDPVTMTDGIDLTHVNLGPTFPKGVLIVQDHQNTHPAANQNFKLVSWADVMQALDLPDTLATSPAPHLPAQSS